MSMSFRRIIVKEAKRQGLSGYALGKRAEPEVSMRAVQAYLAGVNDLSGERIARICEVLGLALVKQKRKG